MKNDNQITLKRIFKNAGMMIIAFAVSAFVLTSCSSGGQDNDGANSSNKTGSSSTAMSDEDAADAAASASANAGKGVGPFADKSINPGPGIDEALATKGKAVFESKCTACHKMDESKYVGPGMKGVTERRKPEWIMNMIINPGEMIQKDPIAQDLLAEHLTQMPMQGVNEDDTRAILEYLRQNDKK